MRRLFDKITEAELQIAAQEENLSRNDSSALVGLPIRHSDLAVRFQKNVSCYGNRRQWKVL